MPWAPPEASTTPSWAPPEASTATFTPPEARFTPPEASSDTHLSNAASSNDFAGAYARQQTLNAAGKGGGSPITPAELMQQRNGPRQLSNSPEPGQALGEGIIAGAEKAPIKLAQGIEAIGRANPLDPAYWAGKFGAPRAFSPEQVGQFSQEVDATHPHPGAAGTVGEVIGGAPLGLAAGAVAGPEAAIPVFTTQGAAGGAATAEDQAIAQGQQPSAMKTLGGAAIGGAAGALTGKGMEVAGGIPNAVGRVAANAGIGAVGGAAEQAGQNILAGQPIGSGVARAAGMGGATQGAFALGGEIHQAFVPPEARTAEVPGYIHPSEIPEGAKIVDGETTINGSAANLIQMPDGSIRHTDKLQNAPTPSAEPRESISNPIQAPPFVPPEASNVSDKSSPAPETLSESETAPLQANRIQRNNADVSVGGVPMKASVSTSENEDGSFSVNRIKFNNPETGRYQDVPVPPEFADKFGSSAEAREAIFQHLESKYPAPKELPTQPPTAGQGESDTIQNAVDDYHNGKEDMTVSDLANRVEAIASDTQDEKTLSAVKKYREDRRIAHDEYGDRGDQDEDEANFLAALPKANQAAEPAGVSTFSQSIKEINARAALEKWTDAQIGQAVMNLNPDGSEKNPGLTKSFSPAPPPKQGAAADEAAPMRPASVQVGSAEANKPKNTGKLFGVEGGAGPLAKAVGFDQATGDTKQGDIHGTLTDRLTAAAQHIADSAKRMSGNLFPTATRLARSSGEAMSRWIASRAYAKEAAPIAAREILGNEGEVDPKMDATVGTLLVQDNLDSIRKGFIKQAQEAETPDDRQEALQNAARVKDIIGAEGSPIKTQTQYEQLLKDPKVQAVVDRYKQWFNGEPDRNYRSAQGIAPDEDLPSRGDVTGARVNLKAVKEGETPTPTTVYTAKRGNLTNPQLKKSPFAKQAFGTGEGYDVRLSSMIENTLAKGTEIARQREAYDQMVKDKLAVYGKPGTNPAIDGKPTIPFDIKKQTVITPEGKTVPLNKKIYVRADVAPEFRQALAVDSPTHSRGLKMISNLANKTALVSSVEASYHLKNQLTAIIKSPGVGAVVPDLVSQSWKLATRDPEAMRQLVDLARIGALRERPNPATGWQKYNPLNLLGKAVNATDRVGRLMMDNAFKNLAAKGLYKDTETNRRDFVNQLGQYNIRGQHELVALSRDLGTGPFATAGTNFYGMGAKALTLSPGAEATGKMAALNLRARVAARYAAVVGGIALTNYLQTGRVDGGKDIPFGAIATGNDDQGKTTFWDALGNLTPLKRGAHLLGLDAAVDYMRGKTTGLQATGAAAKNIAGSAVQPFAGPLVSDLSIAATGSTPEGFHIADYAKKGESQVGKNLKAAAENVNPLAGGLTAKTGTKSRAVLGPFGVGVVEKPPAR